MLQVFYDNREQIAKKLYFLFILLSLMILAPLYTLTTAYVDIRNYDVLLKRIKDGPNALLNDQVPLDDVLGVLAMNPYHGTWEKSIKRSGLLREETGILELRSFHNSSNLPSNYVLKLLVVDGNYRDQGFYEIAIPLSQQGVQQKFSAGELFYYTVSPIIGTLRRGRALIFEKQQAIFINKIKARVQVSERLTLQLLIASEYSINIIVKDAVEYCQSLNDILFAILVILQYVMQIIGLYSIFDQIYFRRESIEKYSFLGMLCATIIDCMLLTVIISLCLKSWTRFSIYIFPATLGSMMIFAMEFRTLSLFQDDERPLRFYANIYGSILIGCTFAYFLNMRGFVFFSSSVIVMFPQIIHNYIVGHRMKVELNMYLFFALPRFSLIPYLRLFSDNIFQLSPDYLLFIGCFMLLAVQVLVLKVQKEYGVRSILPKFMYFTEFKYFINEPEGSDTKCSICLSLIRELPGDAKGAQMYGYIRSVETPCFHKFHQKCIATWMETRLQCPNCRAMLPPIEDCL